MGSSELNTFGALLKQFRNRRGIKQEALAYKIGKQSRGNIDAWERGLYLPSSRDVVLDLAKALYLSEDETDQLLLAAHHLPEFQMVGTKAIEPQKSAPLPELSQPLKVLLPHPIPDEPYYLIPGREQHLQKLLLALSDPQGSPTIVIDGLGGMGKTAIAVELARRALKQHLFEKVIGDSAKQEHFVAGEIIQLNEAILNFDTLLDTIAHQLDHWELPALQPQEKLTKLAQLLRGHRYLLLIDNLESVNNAQELVARIRGLLGNTRALVTSRQKVHHDFVQPVALQHLDLDDALFFIRQDLKQRGGNQLQQAPREKLEEIYEVTGGAPLALKLVVAQTTYLDLDVVLDQLKQAGSNLYPFIFRQSWEQLSLIAQFILIYIGRTVTTTVSWKELVEVGIAEREQDLLTAIRELVGYSLLDVYTTPDQTRYGIHQLTRQFVTSDLPRIWQEQEQQ